MRFSGIVLISLLGLLLRSPVGLGATGPDSVTACPELLPLLQEQLKIHPNARPKPLSPARQAALDTLEFFKRTGFTKLPDYKLNKTLYQRVLKFRGDPEFQAILRENPDSWALIEPYVRRLNTSSAERVAMDTIEFIRSSRFRWLPNQKIDPALYQQFLKYRDDPEFLAVLKRDPEDWARIEPLLKRKEASPAIRAAQDTLEYIKRSGFTEAPNYKVNLALSQRFWKYLPNAEFQEVLKENPQAWVLVEPLLKQQDLSGVRQTALEIFEFIKGTGFTRLPDQKANAALYQRYLRYRELPEFQAALKENPEDWALIEHLFNKVEISPSRQAALDTIEYIKSSGFTELPKHKVNEALYQRFMKYRSDPEFQAVLREHPESWKLFEKKYPQFK